MTRGQGIRKAIILIDKLKGVKGISKSTILELDEIIEHLEFVSQFYL
jgi:hypothetical protein